MEGIKKICPNCGAEYVNGVKCQYCGQQLPNSSNSSENRRNELSEQQKFSSTVIIKSDHPLLPLEIKFDRTKMVVYHAPTFPMSKNDIKVAMNMVCDGVVLTFRPMNATKYDQHYSLFYVHKDEIAKISEAKEILLRFETIPARDFILSDSEISSLKHEAKLLYHCEYDDSKYLEVFEQSKIKWEIKEKGKNDKEQQKKLSMRQSILDNTCTNNEKYGNKFMSKKNILIFIIALLLVFFFVYLFFS